MPLFLILNYAGLLDTLVGVIFVLVGLELPFAIFIMKGFFDTLPRSLDEAALARARRLVGLKGYVTNIPASLMPAPEVIASYHDLWHVEASFRMSKSDLAARPMFARTRDAIEAHLTIVFTADPEWAD